MSPTVLNNWVIHSSSDQYASYSLSDALTVTNNMTIVSGATSIAVIPKYQPVINPPFSLTQKAIPVYDIAFGALNNIEAKSLMKPYALLKPVQAQTLFELEQYTESAFPVKGFVAVKNCNPNNPLHTNVFTYTLVR